MKILFAVDGSEYSDGVAQFLSRLKLSPEDEIMVTHVINFVPFLNEREFYTDAIYHLKQNIAPDILNTIVKILGSAGAVLSTAIMEGDIDTSIIAAAVDSGVDLIITGSTGLKGIKSFIIGSTARSLAHNSPVPVLVIKKAQWDVDGSPRIMFATDGSEFANAAANFLVRMPFLDESHITVLNVIRSAVHDIPERFIVEIDDRMKEEVAKIRTLEFKESEKIIQQAQDILRERYSHVEGQSKVGDPAIEILDAAEKYDTDIIVTGCRGLKGEKGKIGTVTRDIMRHSPCSFLIVKVC